jgi:hypothetical protein
MSNFKKLVDLPVYDLYPELNELLHNKTLHWGIYNQICLNTTEDRPDDFLFGVGSLTHDWTKSETIVDQFGNERIEVPKFETPYTEEQFTNLCSQFKNTLFELVFNELTSKYKIGRIRLMKSKPKTCLSWHVDSNIRIHYPIKTQEGCFMIIENELMHLELNSWWQTNTFPLHTAVNASKEDRIHLVAVVL